MADKKELSDLLKDVDTERIISEAKELGEEISNALDNGYKNALYQSDISVRRAFESRYQAIKFQLEYGVISEEEYYSKLESLRDSYFSKNSQEWYKYTAEIYEYKVGALRKYEDAIRENFAATAEDAEKMLQQISDAKERYESKLFAFGDNDKGFESHTIKIHGYYPTGDPLVFDEHTLADLDEDIARLREFNDTITALKERANNLNISNFSEFFSEMKNLSVEDANILANLLLKANDKTFTDYFSDYFEKKKLTEQIADSFYQDEYEDAAEKIRLEVAKEFKEIPEEFFSYGSVSAESFKAGFQEEIQGLFSGISALLQQEGVSIGDLFKVTPEQNTYSPTYNLYGSGETVAQQLISAQKHAALQRLRGE